MNFKPRLLLVSCILLVNIVSAQKISHSIGIGATFSGSDVSGRTVSMFDITEYIARVNHVGVLYFPRITLVQKKNSSISSGIPLTVGVSWATKNYSHTYSMLSSTIYPLGLYPSSDKKPHFAIEIPIVVDYNIGAGSVTPNKKGFGVYVGGGYAYSYTTFTSGGLRTIESYDPLLRGGARFRLGPRQLYTVGFSYKWTKQYGVQVLKDL